MTPSGLIEQLRAPRAREGPFLSEVFERYRRMTGSMRKVAQITGRLSGVKISKDATSRIAQRLERSCPYLYLYATYLKALNSGAVREMALLVAIGVADDGYREVLGVEAAQGERKAAWRELIKESA